ncbi:peptidoglycan-binding protein [uncultured Tessaracoccus sp.]|uniref:L,D-transpeptidase family protein n=1 Tax=uncultured Tessaracoccus sp. TaxID=905023 RepID=UPI002619FF65|nr:peptidoglycan-binding protein [uncultured Tessaracoccus sp.]
MRNRHALFGVITTLATVFSVSACAPAPSAIPAPRDARVASSTTTPATQSFPSATVTPTPTTVSIKPTPTPTEAPSSPSAMPSPTPTIEPSLYHAGDEGEEIRELQHRLLQLHWFEGEITGSYGPTTQAAVEGFQAKRQLPVTGTVDATTWKRLVEMTKTPTHDEKHNVVQPGPALMKPGDKGDEVRELQSRLRQIGWYGPTVDGVYGKATVEGVRGFQQKRDIPVTGEVDQRTLDRLRAMTHKPTPDELANKIPKKTEATTGGMKLDPRCLSGRAICISKQARQLAWVVDGKVSLTMDVRFGSKRTPTREGAFRVEFKSRHHVSKLYNSKMPYAMFFSGGQAVHYSSDFRARGYNGASHGCVNVRDEGAVAALFAAVNVGDKVIVY